MPPDRRRSSDRLYVPSRGPREREVLRLIEQRPGITPAELQEALGVTRGSVWQIIERLERPAVRREPER